uniref:LIM domain kinase 1 n=1 Tax=Sphaerodactylus townsendi TaxID=933632 RepID=A0ACB8ED14_9SAUR
MRLMLLCCTWRDEPMGEDEASDLPICASCSNSIYDGQYLQALNADWHSDCFRIKVFILSPAGVKMDTVV